MNYFSKFLLGAGALALCNIATVEAVLSGDEITKATQGTLTIGDLGTLDKDDLAQLIAEIDQKRSSTFGLAVKQRLLRGSAVVKAHLSQIEAAEALVSKPASSSSSSSSSSGGASKAPAGESESAKRIRLLKEQIAKEEQLEQERKEKKMALKKAAEEERERQNLKKKAADEEEERRELEKKAVEEEKARRLEEEVRRLEQEKKLIEEQEEKELVATMAKREERRSALEQKDSIKAEIEKIGNALKAHGETRAALSSQFDQENTRLEELGEQKKRAVSEHGEEEGRLQTLRQELEELRQKETDAETAKNADDTPDNQEASRLAIAAREAKEGDIAHQETVANEKNDLLKHVTRTHLELESKVNKLLDEDTEEEQKEKVAEQRLLEMQEVLAQIIAKIKALKA